MTPSTSPLPHHAVIVRAAVVVAVALASVSACSSGSSSGQAPTSTSSVTTSPVSLPAAFPGLTAPALIVKMKSAVGRGAVVTYLGRNSIGNPSGWGRYVISPAGHKPAPGSYLVQTKVDDDQIVSRVLCASQQRASRPLTSVMKVCTDLAVPGLDNTALRAWVGAERAPTATINRQFGPVTAALTFTDFELDVVLDYRPKL